MSLINLKPHPEVLIECNSCKVSVKPEGWSIVGIYNMSYGHCPDCKRLYYKQLPVNAGLFYPGIIDAETGLRVDDLPYNNWYLNDWVDAFNNISDADINVEIQKKKTAQKNKIAILNTIDHCYGHCLFELFNASYYLNQDDTDLIIIVQRNLLWLVPDGVAQIWVVDLPFKEAHKWYIKLDQKLHKLVEGLPNAFICMSFVQTDDSDYDIEKYSRVKPFPLDEWNKRLVTPTVTFIWRTDRFWTRLLPRIIENRYTIRLFPKLIDRWNKSLQLKWIIKFAGKLKKQIPAIDFAIAGMDQREYSFPKWIKDYRYEKHSDEYARRACERYAQSHLVIGCNGSSLILPSCHAGAVINIVPMNQWAVSAGSFVFRNTSIGDTHFRYALLPEEISDDRLCQISGSILRDRSLVELHTSFPWRDHEAKLPVEAWGQFRLESYNVRNYFNNNKGLVTNPK